MEMTGAKAYLVNTGWNGTGKRISIRDTRGIIDAILDGSIEKAAEWTKKAEDLAGRFIKNFAKFTGNEAGKALVAAGPKL